MKGRWSSSTFARRVRKSVHGDDFSQNNCSKTKSQTKTCDTQKQKTKQNTHTHTHTHTQKKKKKQVYATPPSQDEEVSTNNYRLFKLAQ